MEINIEEIVGWDTVVEGREYIGEFNLRNGKGLESVRAKLILNRPAEMNGDGLKFKLKKVFDRKIGKSVHENRECNSWDYLPVLSVQASRYPSLAGKAIAKFINDRYEEQRSLWDRTGFKL